MKRLLKTVSVFLLCLAFCLSFAACGGSNSGESETAGVTCKKFSDDDFYTVIRYVDEKDEDGNVVKELDLKKAVEAAYGEGAVVGRIKKGAFAGSSLESVIVSESGDANVSLTIDSGAFKNMKALKSITLPFVGGAAMADVTPSSASDENKAVDDKRCFGYIFGEESSDYSAEITQNYGAGTKTFYIPLTLTKVEIKSVTAYAIPMYAFCDMTLLSEVKLTDNITAIGESAFKGMTQLEKINIPKTVTRIYASAFEGTSALKVFGTDGFSFDADSALVKIDDSAFKGTKLTSFTLPDSVEVLGDYCFYESSLKTFTFGTGINEIGAFCFAGSKNLGMPEPSGCTIGQGAFDGTNLYT